MASAACTPQLKSDPALTSVNVVAGVPSVARDVSPQHCTVPSVASAHACAAPALTSMNEPLGGVPIVPQHDSVESTATPHEYPSPTATWVNWVPGWGLGLAGCVVAPAADGAGCGYRTGVIGAVGDVGERSGGGSARLVPVPNRSVPSVRTPQLLDVPAETCGWPKLYWGGAVGVARRLPNTRLRRRSARRRIRRARYRRRRNLPSSRARLVAGAEARTPPSVCTPQPCAPAIEIWLNVSEGDGRRFRIGAPAGQVRIDVDAACLLVADRDLRVRPAGGREVVRPPACRRCRRAARRRRLVADADLPEVVLGWRGEPGAARHRRIQL